MSLTSEDIKQLSSQVEKLTMGAPFEVVMQADEIIEQGETMLKDSRTTDPLHSSQVVFDTAGLDDLQASMLKFGKHKYGMCTQYMYCKLSGTMRTSVLKDVYCFYIQHLAPTPSPLSIRTHTVFLSFHLKHLVRLIICKPLLRMGNQPVLC